MPSGGHSNSGPPPNPNAIRRNRDAQEWTHLPAAGRAGDPPAWPLSSPSKRELALWAAEWRRPQGVVWETTGLVLEVALYVRNVVAAEAKDAPSNVRTLVLRQMDSLGLTTGGLARNRWVIDDRDQPAAEAEAAPSRRPSAKERLRLVG